MILGSIYFFLPAGVSNMMPIIAGKWFGPGKPVNKKFFGSHKTRQGFVVGTSVGWFFYLLQVYLFRFPFFQELSIIDYSTTSVFLGFSLAFGALFGDLVESFFKRRLKIKPGKPWVPFDQIDYVLGGLVLSIPFVYLSLSTWAAILVSYFVLVLVVDQIGFFMGLRKVRL